MPKTFLSHVSLVLLLLASASCEDAKSLITPAPPTATSPPSPVPTPIPNGPFPGAGAYVFLAPPPGRSAQPYTTGSRYVLNGDGTFMLQFESFPDGALRGRYKEAEGRITFDFEWNRQSAGATAVFHDNRMTVTYNTVMSLSDFEDAVYVLK